MVIAFLDHLGYRRDIRWGQGGLTGLCISQECTAVLEREGAWYPLPSVPGVGSHWVDLAPAESTCPAGEGRSLCFEVIYYNDDDDYRIITVAHWQSYS